MQSVFEISVELFRL